MVTATACLASEAEAEILEAIARTHGALSEPLGAVRNALLAAELRKEIQAERAVELRGGRWTGAGGWKGGGLGIGYR